MLKIETRLQEITFLLMLIVVPFLTLTGLLYIFVDAPHFTLLLGTWGSRQVLGAFNLLGYGAFLLPFCVLSFGSFFISRFKNFSELREGPRALLVTLLAELILLLIGSSFLGILDAYRGGGFSARLFCGWGGQIGVWTGASLFHYLGLMGSLCVWGSGALLAGILTGHFALVNSLLYVREKSWHAFRLTMTFIHKASVDARTEVHRRIEVRRQNAPLRLEDPANEVLRADEIMRAAAVAVNDPGSGFGFTPPRRAYPSQFKIIVDGKTMIQARPVPEPAEKNSESTAPAEKPIDDKKSAKKEAGFKKSTRAKKAAAENIIGAAPTESAEVEQTHRDEDDESPTPVEPKIKAYKKKYTLPADTLLNKSRAHKTLSEKILRQTAHDLVERLKSFGVDGQITQIHPGVRLTLFEYAPESGMKVSKIQALTTDLALLLGAPNIRMLAPIPGKMTIGFEIPNEESSTLGFADLLPDLKKEKSMELPIAMGKNVYNEVIISDLSAMPHVLISGTTGSGKSVFMNSLISSLLYTQSPKKLRLLMIDPKMIELTPYNGIPHLLLPVVSDVEKAKDALVWAEQEMDRRYQAFAEIGARNIVSFNEQIAKQSQTAAERRSGTSFAWDWAEMPYIVVIVDELADLMITQGKLVEIPITRIAQKARACGIHLVLSTQRPSSEIVTGLIKTNFPSRIAFKVSSNIDSRTILDASGAETLLGNGDMLYKPNGKNIERLQASFISEPEVNRIVASILKNQ